jgi:asparagine synthase (glutamine-hydrolysing)
MCGIIGVIAKNKEGEDWLRFIKSAADQLKLRGPDSEKFFEEKEIGLGHCRLTIIDLSEKADQPMADAGKRFIIIYNGEIFNFKELRKDLQQKGIVFTTNSDTEVLLSLYAMHGKEMLHLLNGFFSFAIYDRQENSCFIARDRFGVKPLLYYEDDSHFVFGSELKALLQFPIDRTTDSTSLYTYLQLNYIPSPPTIYQKVKHLMPGHFLFYKDGGVMNDEYYSLPKIIPHKKEASNYEKAKKLLVDLLDDSVKTRLISDVPLGGFLSGGIDSSIICGLASRHTKHLKTFSIGYKEDEFFDETKYARLVAKHFNCEHTVFTLSRNDLAEALHSVLNYLDQPFGDSSALPVFVLSKFTRNHVKVALSGDGADELFGGYLKHSAEYRARNPKLPEHAALLFSPLLKKFSQSRNTQSGNVFRRLQKFTEGMKMNPADRYWRWCSVANEQDAGKMLGSENGREEFFSRKKYLTRFIQSTREINNVLENDLHLVLPDDMLVKEDLMSMANGLEVRTPFLDYRVVEFAFSLPGNFKIDRNQRKKILRDAFKEFLPAELYNRPKKGFEIPLHSFLTKELKSTVENHLSNNFINDQNIFSVKEVQRLKEQLFSGNPGDSAARVWGLLMFQHWWKRWLSS